MAHTHPVVDSDSRFVINSTTREISTTSDKLELIQGDHQSERITFEIPKIVEGHDMSLSDRIEVHYINIDRRTNATSRDVYIIDDAAVDGDKLTFSWLISGNATKYYGRLNFIILFECLDPDGNYTYKWNTEICKLLTIGEGISNTSAVIEDHSDILEKFKKEILEEAGENSIQLNITSAAVGQIAKITSVDENGKPTAWEAVDMPSGGSSVPKPLTYDYMPEGYPTKSVQTTTLMEEQQVAFTQADYFYMAQLTNAFKIVDGQTYTVNWDGAEYKCVYSLTNSKIPILGNPSVIGDGADTGEPFTYVYNIKQAVGMFATLNTSASHTISVKTTGEIATPIAEEFLPAGVGGGGGSTVELDTTLTQSGKAADAKAVGDALANATVSGSGWTTAQINLLDSLFSAIPWTTGAAGALADSLIASLRATSSGGGGTGGETDNITQSGSTLIITSMAIAPTQSGSVLTIA